MAAAAVGSPCGACRFLRRKCAPDCIFAPYFCCPDQGPEKFAAIHKVFGASNVSKLLLNLPVHNRGEAVLTVGFEAQARLRDPVYGSVAHIYALQQQVACLEAQVMELRAQLGHNTIQGNKLESQQWPGTSTMTSSSSSMEPLLLDNSETCFITSSISSSIESTTNINEDCRNHDRSMLGMQECGKRQRTSDYWSELQELALRMMKD